MVKAKEEQPIEETAEEETVEETTEGAERLSGTVKWFNVQKGYGFITGDDGNDYFVHYTAVPEGTVLKEGDSVTFEPEQTDKGKQAKNVQK